MAEQLLDDPQVRAAVEQVGREGVAERVRARRPSGQAGPAAEPVEAVAQAADAERAPWWFRKTAVGTASQPAAAGAQQHRPAVVEVAASASRAGRPEQPDPLLAALAQHPELAAAQVEAAQVRRRPAR